MKLSRREEFLLWRLLEFPIHRYLLSLSRSGVERAERHIEISKTLWEVEHIKTALPEHHKEWMAIHDLIAEKLTDHLPKTIGYDPEEEDPPWDSLADRFFKRLLALDYK